MAIGGTERLASESGNAGARPSQIDGRDRGAVLPLVLVLMVIGALVVIPLLQYSVTVSRAGQVEADKARSIEYARSGLRTALVSTKALYEGCGDFAGDSPRVLESPELPGVVSTTCRVVATAKYLGLSEVPFHLATLQIGQPIPGEFADPHNYDNPLPEAAWQADRSPDRETGTVWVPNLPARPDVVRTSTASPDGNYGRPMSFGTCDVYFPGTYQQPVVVQGPRATFFVSGLYYFESTITFRNGADAVIGDGEIEGCTSDLDAMSYADPPPDTALISGVGATIVLGDDARIVADNSAGPVRVRFNQRYVDASEEGALPSAGVSIMTVNGDLDDANPTGAVLPLVVEDVIAIPPANLGITGAIVNVSTDGYIPSVHTPEPIPPEQPDAPTATAYRSGVCGDSAAECADMGAAFLSWTAPEDNGFVVRAYFVEQRSRPGDSNDEGAWTAWESVSCPIEVPIAPGGAASTSCTVQGLNGYGGGNNTARSYEFRIIAASIGGQSVPSVDSNVVRPRARTGDGQDPALDVPAGFSVDELGLSATNYRDGKLVEWTPAEAPDETGGYPVLGYRVVATPVFDPDPPPDPIPPPVECTSTWESTECLLTADDPATTDFEGLVRGQAYTVVVYATNALGESVDGPAVPLVHLYGLTDDEVAALPTYEPPPPPPEPSQFRVPDPVIDVRATGTAPIDMRVTGYVSIPQGRVAFDGGPSPDSHEVLLLGGAVTARIDTENTGPGFAVRLDNPTTQKTILLSTTYDGRYDARAEAVVQVNSNFGWGLNSWEAS